MALLIGPNAPLIFERGEYLRRLFFFCGAGLEPWALYMVGKHSTAELYPRPFVIKCRDTGYHCILQADLELSV